jgi:5-methylthioadenosine/S-adenosylhomocysteine deaminase
MTATGAIGTTVIHNATIVTVDLADRIVHGSIRIDHGVISEVGPDNVVNQRADVSIDARGAILMPGLFNAHAHLAMSLLRGIADGTNLDEFLATVLPIEGALLNADFVRTGTELAAAECLRSGITSVLDMYFFPEAALIATDELGLRLHTGPVFIQFPGADERPWDARMAWAKEWFLRPPASTGSTRWAAPHSTYLLTEPQLRELAALVNDTGVRVHVHAAETRAEVAQVAELHNGRTPIQVLNDVGLLTSRTVLAHAVHLTDNDIALIASAGAHVSHNPASNAKLASGLAPVRRLLDAGVNVALGTDGAASANDLDIWMAIRLAGFLPSIMHDDPTEISAKELVRMATINGAKAMGVDSLLGSIEVGKRADLVMLDPDAFGTMPSFEPLGTLAYATTRAEVHTVMVGGNVVVSNGRVLNAPVNLAERVLLAASDVHSVSKSANMGT